MRKKLFTFLLALMTSVGMMWAEPVTVVFEANNNQKEVEVTLPHTFACDFQNGQGELDGIIQELYALQYGGYCQAFTVPTATGNAAVTASKDGNNHYIAISEAFEGTATVTGNYIKYLDTEQLGNGPVDYTLTISVQGSAQATGLQVIEMQVPDSWENDQQLVIVPDLPGFVVFTLEEAGTWAAPEGYAHLIYTSKNNEGVRVTYFNNGVWGQEYVAGITRATVFGWASSGHRIFYTTDGSAPAQPSWVLDGDEWDEGTKTLTVNSNPGAGAYASQSEIENLIISDAVTSIGQAAFGGCSNISYVSGGNNIQTIGVGAFTMCGFTSIELPASVTTIGKSAFYSCSNLSSVTIGNNVASIGDHAFDACGSLTEITIPASVTTIGVDAFYNCTGMTDVYCYPNAADLTWNEDGCDDFKSGNATQCHVNADQLDAYQTKFNGVVRVTFVGDLPAPAPAGLQVTELEIPASWQNDQTLVTISDLPGFVAVSLEEAETWDAAPEGDVILIYAGKNDEGVTAIEFNNRVLNDFGPFGGFSRADIFDWGYKIFYTSGGSTPAVDPAVQNVIDLINAIPNQVAYNDECKNAIDAARAAYDALTDAQKTLVENYGALLDAETAYAQLAPNPSGECGAQGDNLLWELNTSTGVLTITGSGAMYDWAYDTDLPWYDNRLQITSVVLPSGITSIGTKAFRGCQNLASINMTENYPAGLTAINQEAFCHTALTSVTIPKSVVTIGQDAFYQSQSITDVYCYADPNNLTWTDFWGDDFNQSPSKSTQCHVKDCYLDVYNSKWNTGTTSTDVNVTFVGDLPGDCGGSTPTPTPSGDKLSGVFSISSTETVNFSKGNLQYVGGAWQFAAHQWDVIGTSQADNNRDLFGWGTGNNPNQTSEDNGDYATFNDWGDNLEGGWRTLTQAEWNYILNSRSTDYRFSYAVLNIGVNSYRGLIILPDDWDPSYYALSAESMNQGNHSYDSNVISEEDWTNSLEAHGAVFLPASGIRTGNEVENWYGDESTGNYWTSFAVNDANACYLSIEGGWGVEIGAMARCKGLAVRLVSETAPGGGSTPTNPEIKLNADFSGSWANTEAFTDNGDGKASWSISTLTAGEWYHFGVMVDDTWVSDNAAFSRENPSRAIAGNEPEMWFQADVAGEYTFTWEYATNTLTIGYPVIHTYTAVGQNLGVFGNSWDASITANDLVLQEDGSYKWEKENVSFTGAITIQYRVCEDHAWGVAYPATSEQPASFEIPSLGDYKITITYNPVGNVISASAEKIAKPTILLNGNFSGEWADTEAFEVTELPMHSYAKLTKLLEPGTYEFGVKVNGEWRANGSAYTRENYSYIIEEGHTGNLTINVDVKGYYSFFWYYDDNRLTIDYSRVCGMYWKDVTAGNFEVTLGQEGEVTLPKVWATSMAFVSNIANGSDQVRLGSTDETVATIAYTLSLDGLGTLTFHQAGECDIYVVHDITNLYCYDSCAFHLTVLPAPAPAPTDEQVPTNEDPENPGVYYYSTFFHSSQNYALTNDGTTAFVADLSGSDLVLTKIAEGTQVIPANTAVILRKSGSNEPVVLAPTSEPGVSFEANNDLQGVDEPTTLESLSIDPLKCYVLSGSDQYGVGFYRINGNTLKAHKAYVIYSGNNGPKRMRFVFDTATGMDEVQSDQVQSTKVLENGQLFIIRDGVRYNVQGQLVK